MSLYYDYHSRLRTQVLSNEPLPLLDRVFQLVVQGERVRTARHTAGETSPDILDFSVRVVGRGRCRGMTDRSTCRHSHKVGHEAARCWYLWVCYHCKKNGHEVGQRIEMVGYPESWEANRKSDSGSGSRPATDRGRGSPKDHATASVGAPASSNSSSSTSCSLFNHEL